MLQPCRRSRIRSRSRSWGGLEAFFEVQFLKRYSPPLQNQAPVARLGATWGSGLYIFIVLLTAAQKITEKFWKGACAMKNERGGPPMAICAAIVVVAATGVVVAAAPFSSSFAALLLLCCSLLLCCCSAARWCCCCSLLLAGAAAARCCRRRRRYCRRRRRLHLVSAPAEKNFETGDLTGERETSSLPLLSSSCCRSLRRSTAVVDLDSRLSALDSPSLSDCHLSVRLGRRRLDY